MNQNPESPPPKAEMDFLSHLGELRKRLVIVFSAILIGAVAAYFFTPAIIKLLSSAFHEKFTNELLIGTGPAEAFILKIKVAVFSGCIAACPVIFHQFWLFISPGLYEHERRLALPFILATTALFLGGVAFCHYVVFPFAFEFFHEQYQSIEIVPTVRISEHLAFVMQGLIAFGIIFELPVLAFLLGKLGVIDDQTLVRYWRHALVLIMIVSALLTPPDVVTQLLMALPLSILYCASIWIVRLTAVPRRDPENAEAPAPHKIEQV